MTTQNVNVLSPVGYLNTVTGHIWTLTEQPDAAEKSGLYEPLVLSREALVIVQQKDALQLSVDNILRGLGITGDGSVTQLVLEKFISLQTERDALAAENAIQDFIITAVKDLVRESEGVTGWHLNGDVASWDEVLPELSHSETPATAPATAAAIAEIKAQGVDAFAASEDAKVEKWLSGDEYASYASKMAEDFAANLRAGRKG